MSTHYRLVLATTAITMLGPGLALRGPDGSMNCAVDGILVEFELVSRILNANVQVFLATGGAFAFLNASPSLFCSFLLSALSYLCYRMMNQRMNVVESDFPLKSIPLVSGTFFRSTGHGHAHAVVLGGGAPVPVSAPRRNPHMSVEERRTYAQLHDIVE
mmetsp:Transcript_18981/g.57388  ORF Transcript_18981/g.57388 Transcript_18981/m.57388 type:complete len:159 (+) Transcript_18981:241-717(+)